MRRHAHHRPWILKIEQRLIKRDAIFGWCRGLLRARRGDDRGDCERREENITMDFGSSIVEDFHDEAVPSFRSVRTGIFIAQRASITTQSSFRSEMDVAPKRS